MKDSLSELLTFLQIGARLDLKVVALDHLLGLTGTEENIEHIIGLPQILVSLISLLHDTNESVAKDSGRCLVNISASEKGSVALVNLDVSKGCPPLQSPPDNIVLQALKHIFNKESKLADLCCMILSNISRPTHLIEKIVDFIEESTYSFDDLVNIFTKNDFNKHAKLYYLGPLMSNLSQSSRVRKHILDKDKCVIQKLLPFTEFKQSLVKRGGVVGTLKNCCFENDYHEWLLSEDVDILPRLLLPLSGPEEFDEEDNDKLPLDLQYLPETKEREEDPDIRCILLEAVTQLCTKRQNREYIRDKNTYVILRELHKWEKDRKAQLACENLVDILIRKEDEIGADNLKDIEVPQDVQENLNKMEAELLKEA